MKPKKTTTKPVEIRLPQKNNLLKAKSGENLMQFLLKNEIPVASSCGGEGICNKCILTIKNKGESIWREEFACQLKIKNAISVKATYW